MKKAVITTGGKQYIVHEGETLEIELLEEKKNHTFKPLLVIDDKDVKVGTPYVESASVTATTVDQEVKAEKVLAIRYKPKKRVHKIRGHRQRHTRIQITKIS